MYWLIAFITLSLVATIGSGIYLELRSTGRVRPAPRWLKGTLGANLLIFILAQVGLLLLGVDTVLAQSQETGSVKEVSLGLGLALIGVGVPTAVAALAAGLAVGTVGAAALAVIAEKPESFGRTLVYLGLAEGIAIYGLVVSILMLGKL